MHIKFAPLGVCFVLLPLFSGCATWAQHGVSVEKDERVRIAVLPLEVTAKVEKLSEIMTSPPKVSDERLLIQERMQDEAAQLTDLLQSTLRESRFFELVPLVEAAAGHDVPALDQPQALTVAELQKLKADRNIQAVLVVKLAGYGKLKKKWVTYLIGSGVVEGVVQGVVAARVVDSTAIGLLVALEEIGQEILVWGGGSYLFNQHYAPVTLEAELISTMDGARFWQHTVFVSVDKEAIEKLPPEEQKKRELHLQLTAQKAIKELVEDINEAAKSYLGFEDGSLQEAD